MLLPDPEPYFSILVIYNSCFIIGGKVFDLLFGQTKKHNFHWLAPQLNLLIFYITPRIYLLFTSMYVCPLQFYVSVCLSFIISLSFSVLACHRVSQFYVSVCFSLIISLSFPGVFPSLTMLPPFPVISSPEGSNLQYYDVMSQQNIV